MDAKRLKEAVLAATFEEAGRRKLACGEAFRLAAEHEVEKLAITRICNAEGVKICKCQLGCFK